MVDQGWPDGPTSIAGGRRSQPELPISSPGLIEHEGRGNPPLSFSFSPDDLSGSARGQRLGSIAGWRIGLTTVVLTDHARKELVRSSAESRPHSFIACSIAIA